jgi:hypothetical protein
LKRKARVPVVVFRDGAAPSRPKRMMFRRASNSRIEAEIPTE